ncbi:sporulation histidine kinase inhibitor Sda [Shouchella patagoniensis]|nr:sporulation histidine kinase inhibitor Sda [Shouchella patagoniensis]
MSLNYINDTLLIEAYEKAVKHGLNQDFIELIKSELLRRNIRFDNDGSK